MSKPDIRIPEDVAHVIESDGVVGGTTKLTVKPLHAKHYHRNPRSITAKRLKELERSLDRLGDISCIVHNRRTDEIIGGNQRKRVFEDGEVTLVKTFDAPDAQGTVAWGFIVWHGANYPYRLVDWDEDTAAEANVKANIGAGEWDADILANQWDAAKLVEWGAAGWGATDSRHGAMWANLVGSESPSSSDDDEDGVSPMPGAENLLMIRLSENEMGRWEDFKRQKLELVDNRAALLRLMEMAEDDETALG